MYIYYIYTAWTGKTLGLTHANHATSCTHAAPDNNKINSILQYYYIPTAGNVYYYAKVEDYFQ